MNVSPAKENILKRVRHALSQPVQLPFPQAEGNQSVFRGSDERLEILFGENFSRLLGRFVFCTGHEELAANLRTLGENQQWKHIYCRELGLITALEPFGLPLLNASASMEDADAGLTSCEALVARTGSVMMSSGQPSGRTVGIFPPVHLVVAYLDQVVFDIRDALKKVREKYGETPPSMVSFQSGPSRTSDIEKKSVVGVHGPKEVYVFLVDQPQAL